VLEIDYIIIVLLLIVIILLFNINNKLPKRDYTKEAVDRALERDTKKKQNVEV